MGSTLQIDSDFSLVELTDVAIDTPTTGQVLTYDGAQWINQTSTLGGLTSTQFLRSDADDTFSGKLSVASTDGRDAGMYGTYDSYRTAHIWSMGAAYSIAPNGANFGNIYGLAYKHTNNTTGGAMAGGHQMVWATNGNPTAALGQSGIWTSGWVQADYFNGTTGNPFRGYDADGSSAPSFTWSGDLDTGMYRSSTNAIGLSTGGSIAMLIDMTRVRLYERLEPNVMANGTQTLSIGSYWTPSIGVYQYAMNTLASGARLQFYTSGAWRDALIYANSFFTDGSNVRFYNGSNTSITIYWQRFGG